MRLLFVGDVVGTAGVEILKNRLGQIKKEENIDFTVVNGENSADHNGIDKDSANILFAAGADVITTGNHVYDKKDTDFLDESPYIIRPANYPESAKGKGYCIYDMRNYSVAVVNLEGRVYGNYDIDNPFTVIDPILADLKDKAKIIIVDLHCEATSEKRAMGYYLDGRVSAVIGTHTHVLTNDEEILENGTAFITDAGFTGSKNSVLGVNKEIVIDRFVFDKKVQFLQENAPPFIITGLIVEIDEKTGKAVSVKTLKKEYLK